MLINVLQPEECRIAILEDGLLEELYVERTSQESYVGNVYKGKIVNIEPSIQAAFVDFGIGRNGFLHVSDVDPAYYKHLNVRGGNGGSRGGRDDSRGNRRDNGGRGGRREDEPRRAPAEDRPRREDEPRGRRDEEPRRTRDDDRPRREEEPRGRRDDNRDQRPPQRRDDRQGGQDRPPRRDEPRPSRRDDYLDEEPSGRRNPPIPEPKPRDADVGGFASGIFDEPAPATPVKAAPPPPPTPEDDHHDDPYAHLVREFGEIAPSDPEPPKPRRGRSRPEPKAAEPESPPPLPKASVPEPAPEPKDDFGGFGAGLWEDDGPPAPYMPSAESRTREDDDDEFEEGSSFGPSDDDDDDLNSMLDVENGDESDDGDDDDDETEEGGSSRPRHRGPRGFDRNRRRGGRDGDGHQKPLIQDIFKRGQEVLVQVIKEGIGTKGPTLSTYISIAGRYLVLMPGLSRVGVSRKIADIEQRNRLRDILAELKPPAGLGFIIRTAGTDKNKKELQNDLNYLLRIWQVIVKRIKGQKGPGVIHTESDMITRTLRDTFTADVDAIWIDEPKAYEHAREFLSAVMPRYANRLKLYDQTEPLFHRHNLDGEIAKIQQKKLPLPGGGSIIIEQTEALVAIDVNSGNFRADNNNAEETAFQINLAAAKEIARQLRLRDLGGVIVNDFIDMKDDKHRRAVEKAMRDAVKRDRARTKVLRISQFGLIEMTRQRIRPSLRRSVFQECGHCGGFGYVKTPESMSIEVMRFVQLAACRDSIKRVDVRVHAAVADYLVNRRRREIAQLEESRSMTVSVVGLRDVPPERMELICQDANGSEIPLQPVAPAPKQPHHHRRR